MSWYRARVEREVARWQSSGWVSETGATAIRADLAARRSAVGAAGILAILGAILFGFAVMSFVAANWSTMSKLARLLLLVALLWACYGGAAYLLARRLGVFAHAAVLGGIAVFGANIMLIAQMYHMEGNPPDAVLVWALGALLAAVLVRSNAALAATFVLLTVWTGMERGLRWEPHWVFLVPWAAVAGTAAWLRWRPGLHLAALSLLMWLVPLGYFVLDKHAHWVVAAIGAGAALAATALSVPAIERRIQVSQAMFAYGVAVAFAGLFIMQHIDHIAVFGSRREALGQFAALTLVLLVAAMYWAVITDNRGALWIGYVAFAVEIFLVYVEIRGEPEPHWVFLAPWAATAAVATWLGWRPGLHLAALSLVAWLVPLGYLALDRDAQHWLVAANGLAAALAAIGLTVRAVERRIPVSQAMFSYGSVAVAFAGLFTLQFIDPVTFAGLRSAQPLGQFAALAALTLILLVAVMYWADNRGALWIAYVAFAVEIFTVYGKMLGTLLNTSLFFLVAALIVSALAFAAYRLHQRQVPAKEAAA